MYKENLTENIDKVLNVDAVAIKTHYFLSTHVPFDNIKYEDMKNVNKKVTENEVFSNIFEDPAVAERHQFIIVKGSNGTGKSHFIRWLHSTLLTKSINNIVPILIGRSDSTLKGTIKQIINNDEVKNIPNKQLYQNLVNSSEIMQEPMLKDKICNEFSLQVRYDEKYSGLGQIQKNRLSELLQNKDFQTSNLIKNSANGPIDRICEKISSKKGIIVNEDPSFNADDFRIDIDAYQNSILPNASREARNIAGLLVDGDDFDYDLAEKCATLLNSKLDSVVQSCSGIHSGDINSVFKEIRRELYKKGKSLAVFIEDITSSTGINGALIDALNIQHTGVNEKDQLCKLVSIVGTTNAYYEQFRDNFKDRVTLKLTIDDDSIGKNKNNLYLFFAKYLNSAFLNEKTIINWFNSGADEYDLPAYNNGISWDSISNNGKQYSLYPFTKKAIDNLYMCMEDIKTPRYIIMDIITPILREIVNNESYFPSSLKSFKGYISLTNESISTNTNRIVSLLENEKDKIKYFDRYSVFLSVWGNGLAEKNSKAIYGINKEIFDEFGLDILWNHLQSTIDTTISDDENEKTDNIPLKVNPVKVKAEKDFKEYENTILKNWMYNNQKFTHRPVWEELATIYFEIINWEDYGISKKTIELIKITKSLSLISIEDVNNTNESLFQIKRKDADSYSLLRAIGRFIIIGSKKWDYDGGLKDFLTIITWFENRIDSIIDSLKSVSSISNIHFAQILISNEIIKRIIIADNNYSNVESINSSSLFDYNYKNSDIKKCDKWENKKKYYLQQTKDFYMKDVVEYFSMQQGNSNKIVLDFESYHNVFNIAKSLDFIIDKPSYESAIKAINSYCAGYYKDLKDINDIIEEQQAFNSSTIKKIYNIWDWDIDEYDIEEKEIIQLLNALGDLFSNCEKNGVNIYNYGQDIDQLKQRTSYISKQIELIKKFNRKDNVISQLLYLSYIDTSDLEKILQISKYVEQNIPFINGNIDSKNAYLDSKGVFLDKDNRFDVYNNDIEKMKEFL